MDLLGRHALITGSTSGIGLGIAETLAKHGCNIVLNGFGDDEAIAAIQRRLAEVYGVRVTHASADVSRAAECRELAQRAREFGPIDILVNNAGIQHVAPVEEFPAERWDAVLAVNLSAAFHLVRETLPGMRERGWGRIVNVASVHGLVGSRDKSAYVAAKHGLVGLTKVIALETAGAGVTCNAVCPGWVLTPLLERQITQRMDELHLTREHAEAMFLQEKQPSGQFTTATQVGELVAYLCSEFAANITGALPVDGGWTTQ